MKIMVFETGEVEYKILEAVDWKSKAGNESIRLHTELTDFQGLTERIYCYLTPKMSKLIGSFCDAHDLQKQWEARELRPRDCMNKSGRCKTFCEHSDKFGDRVKIKEFEKPPVTDGHGMLTPPIKTITQVGRSIQPSASLQQHSESAPAFDDDIPFGY